MVCPITALPSREHCGSLPRPSVDASRCGLAKVQTLVSNIGATHCQQPGCREFVGHAGELHPLPLFSLTEYHRIICCTLRWKRLQWHLTAAQQSAMILMRQASMTSSSKKVALKKKMLYLHPNGPRLWDMGRVCVWGANYVFAPQWTEAPDFRLIF